MSSLGIDIGCISLKAALAGEAEDHDLYTKLLSDHPDLFEIPADGLTVVDGRPVLVAKYRRIKGSPGEATQALLDELLAVLPEGKIEGVRVTGSGGRLIGQALDASFENEFKAITRGVSALAPQTRTIFEMGGETSKFIRLEPDEETRCHGITDYQTNGDCAAGTGSFMDQQASRLLYDIEDVGDIVLDAGKAASIAGRCSVFAKSDMIHAQQKGYQPPEVLRGLCDAVMRNFKGTIAKGKVVEPPIAFIGGVAANKGAVQALQEAFDLEPGDLFIPEYHAALGAVGAALIEADYESARAELASLDASRLPAADFPVTEPLSMAKVTLLRDMAEPFAFADDTSVVNAYMGIDIGSVSTNLVVIDDEGRVIKEIYTKTDARPVEVVTKGLQDIYAEIGARLDLRGVGTTGSGRELIGELCGADIITDEITAHKTGADFIGRKIGRQVDTIFEIGGQDSKFISLQDGIVVDFAMNEACAAGTGSFLEEQAEKLGINIIDEFAELALELAGAHPPGRALHRVHGARRHGVPAARRASRRPGRRARLLHRHQLPQPPGARAHHRRHDLLPGRHGLQRRRGRGLQPDPGQGDHRAAAQRRHGRARHGAARPRARAAHRRAQHASAAGTSARSTTPWSTSSATPAPTSATCASSPSRARRPTGATSAPTGTASRPRWTRSP